MIQRHSKVLSAVGTAKIYQPIPIVIKLKFKSVSRAHEYLKSVTLALLSSLNPYHCPNYTFFFSCTKGIFFYLLVSEFALIFLCNALWFLYLCASYPCNFPWEISLKSYVSFKSGSVAPMDPCMYFQNNKTEPMNTKM